VSPSTALTPKPSEPVKIPTYVALSYFWGDASVTEELLLDGQPVQKTVNLIAGLRQLRDLLANPSRAPRTLRNHDVMFWIDALCIDQENVDEKSMQVPRMGTIFGSARIVVAWLGENGADDDKIRQVMNLGNTFRSKEQSSYSELKDAVLKDLRENRLADIVLTLERLSQRPWFDRIWVVQEMVRARRSLILAGSYWCHMQQLEIICFEICRRPSDQPLVSGSVGILSRLMRHSTIRAALEKTKQTIYSNRPAEELGKPHSSSGKKELNGDSNDQALQDYKNTTRSSGKNVFRDWAVEIQRSSASFDDAAETLRCRLCVFILRSTLAQMLYSYKATVPHDYLYGILSTSGITRYPQSLAPDYSLPFAEVFHRYTVAILEHTGELSLLPRKIHGLMGVPSWVPDFRFDTSFVIGAKFLQQQEIQSVNPDVRVSKDGRVCVTRGIYLGEVMLILERRNDIGSKPAYYDVVSRFDKFIEDACREQRFNKQVVLASVFGSLGGSSKTDHRVISNLLGVYNYCLSGLLCTSDQGDVSLEDILIQLSKNIAEYSWLITSRGLIARPVRDGEAPKTGDVLAMMKGTNDPWLLHPVVASDHEEYTFLGGCHKFYGPAQYTVVGNSRLGDDEKKMLEEFFASNEVREFHLV
jgi:hypothetical protein